MPVPKIVTTAIMTAANMALTASQKIKGPRLEDLTFTGGDAGGPRLRFWGLYRGVKTAIWAEDLREVKRKRKTKGGKYENYEYFGTWDVEVAAHQCDAVTRVWLDNHLVYDLTGAGPVMPFGFGDAAPNANPSEYVNVYLGDPAQEPDPRMEATIDGELGAGHTPAYRYSTRVAFRDLPLGNFGNRPPQVIVEATNNSGAAYPVETFDTTIDPPSRLQGATFSPDFSTFYWAYTGSIEIWDTASRTQISAGDLPVDRRGGDTLGIFSNGTIVAAGEGQLATYSPDGLSGSYTGDVWSPDGQEGTQVIRDGNGDEHTLLYPYSSLRKFYVDGVIYDPVELTGEDWQVEQYFADEDGNIWAAAQSWTSSSTVHFYRVVTIDSDLPQFLTITGLPSNNVDGAAARNGKFILHQEVSLGTDKLHLIDPATETVDLTVDRNVDVYNTKKQWINLPPSADTIWLNSDEVSLIDLSLVRSVALTNWGLGGADGIIYDPVNHALIVVGAPGSTTINWAYLDRVSSDGVTLGTIVGEVCEIAGMEPGEYDVSKLTQTVIGYGVSQGDGKDWISPLLDFYDVDARPNGFVLDFLPRAGVAASTISASEFARADDVDTPLYSRPVKGSTDLPKQVTVNFRDAEAEQKPNSASSPPISSADGERELILDLSTLVLTPDEARDRVTQYHRRMEFDGGVITADLSAMRIALQPGDVHDLAFETGTQTARLAYMQPSADGRIVTQWRRDDPSISALSGLAGGSLDGHIPSEIIVPLPTKGHILDMPLISDADDRGLPIAYVAAAPFAENGNWPGAVVYRVEGTGAEEELTEDFANIASGQVAVWGTAQDILPAAPATIWDRSSVLTVRLARGTLTSATEDAIDANPRLNLFAIGNGAMREYVQAATVVLTAPLTYELSNLKRGRFGTEWAIDSHVANESVLLMDELETGTFEVAEIGTTADFKTITRGRLNGFGETVLLQGNSLKPYAPANVTARKLENGDWLIEWNRCSRIGAGWGLIEVPLGEASEAYELDLGNGIDSETKTTSASPFTWSAADQVTDMGAEVPAGSLDGMIYQMSATVGRGFPASLAA